MDSNKESEDDSALTGAHGRSRFSHAPVLLHEAIEFLAIKRGGTYVDATLGLGGHSSAIATLLGSEGKLIGFDKDTNALEMARKRLTAPEGRQQDWPEITLHHASYAEMAKRVPPGSADGVLADLGVSSMQFDDASRGFSFQAEGPLDMRMKPHAELSADQVVNQFDESNLADLIYEFGEERRSRRIARAIVRARPIKSTAHLAQVVSAAARSIESTERERHSSRDSDFPGDPNLRESRTGGFRGTAARRAQVVKPGGRLVVISFHSLEDRMVKDAMRDGAKRWRMGAVDQEAGDCLGGRDRRRIRGRVRRSCGRRFGWKSGRAFVKDEIF